MINLFYFILFYSCGKLYYMELQLWFRNIKFNLE